MFTTKRKDPPWLKISRWLTRLFCIGFIGVFLFLFIGEGGIEKFTSLTVQEQLRLVSIPVLFTVGFLISFVRERLGGVLMVLSVVSFHGIPWLYDKKMPNHWEYWWLLIPAMLFLFFSIIAQKQRKKRRYQRKNFDEVVNNNP